MHFHAGNTANCCILPRTLTLSHKSQAKDHVTGYTLQTLLYCTSMYCVVKFHVSQCSFCIFLLWPPYEIGRPLYFCPVVTIYLSIFFSSPNLSGWRLDVYHTSSPHMVWTGSMVDIQGVALVRI